MAKIIGLFQSRAARDRRFTELVHPHLGAMYRMAYRWTQNSEDAEDFVQETLTKVVDRVEEMEKVEKLGSWLIRIMYRCFVDSRRKLSRSPGQDDSDWRGDLDLFDEKVLNIREVNRIGRLELQRDLIKALETLNHDQRDIVLLHDTEGYSASEIASILDISIGTVKSRLHRARAQLKNFLGTF